MSKRNFILLIIVLVLVIAGVFGFLYLRSGTTPVDVVSDGTNFLSQFNPFGSNPNTPTNTAGEVVDLNGDGVITQEELTPSKLKKISSMPIAGFTVFSKERLKDLPIPIPVQGDDIPKPKPTSNPVQPPTEFAPALRYVDKATGNIYQTFIDKIEERKFSTTVIPKIYDAYFGMGGQRVVMRHLKPDDRTIETIFGIMPKEILGADTESNEIKGSLLIDDIKDIATSPDNSKIFYLSSSGPLGDSAIGTIFNLSDSKKTQVFNSAFTEWNSFWPNGNTVTLTTKPSGSVLGHMYMLDVAKKTFSQVLGGINGLTTLMSPNGRLVLVGNNDLSLYVYRTDTKAYETLGVKTLPEKCVWNKDSIYIFCAVPTFIEGALYPDDWYRGEISFSDQIWKISLIDGNTSMIADPILTGEDVDGIKLALDKDENNLFFVNKKDSFLWGLELK